MTTGDQKYRIDLQPVGRRVDVTADTSLLDAAREAGVELVAVCGGVGVCGTCRVRLAEGHLTPPTLTEEAELSVEEIAAGHRMACQAFPLSDVRIDIPPESLTTAQRLQVEGQGVAVEVDPVTVPVEIQITPPDLYDLRSDATRLKMALAERGFANAHLRLPVAADLSARLRRQDWRARLALRRPSSAWRSGEALRDPSSARRSEPGMSDAEVVAVLPPESRLLGLAVDVGTTKLAAYLVDLTSGETLSKAGAMNPQIAYGEDVIARIAYAIDHQGGRQVLQSRLVETLNQLVTELCAEADAAREQVVEAVLVGNTAMHHLLAGLPVHQLGAAPYVPSVSEALEFPASEIGLELASGCYVYLPPNIAGYVGADHVAMLLGTDLAQGPDGNRQGTVIALDIGTNTEVSLYHRGKILSCSCASGPAFEGAHIHDGMRAAPGAVERVRIAGEEVQIHTIGGAAPVGICGSGILDAIGQMLSAGLLDHRGVLSGQHPSLRSRDGKAEFILARAATTGHGRDLVVNRRDVNEIQLAKGAIRAGVEILLREAGISDEDIDVFIVAGAFGTYLDLESAVVIGMFPDISRQRFRQVGNAAGSGARQMLVSGSQRQLAAEIVQSVGYVELTTHPAFRDEFVRALTF
jgi:uncharacterized 2Fe-2S/4Fe-4S cluster protein (DUF4445 family)